MITKALTEAETLAIFNGAVEETEENWLMYSENFFEHRLQDRRPNTSEMERILGNLEDSARVGNEVAGAVLGKAVLNTFTRRQVVGDALSYLTRAMRKKIPGAAVELCHWYHDRMTDFDLDDFEDVDVGVDDCYEPTSEFPRVEFPKDDDECIARMMEAARFAVDAGDFDEVSFAITSTLMGVEDMASELIAGLDASMDRFSSEHVTDSMVQLAAIRMVDEALHPNRELGLRILARGVEQNNALSLGILGAYYKNGHQGIVQTDSKKAFAYLSKAVEFGNVFAMSSLAECYNEGIGVEKDAQRGHAIMFDAAEAGNPEAMVTVGGSLIEAGVDHKDSQAVKKGCDYIRRAAEEHDYPSAWEAMLRYHDLKIGPFKTNKFARAAREALKRFRKVD